jgi:mRNA-degrading endonuclease toxin of MazEF toxin-antitoxin module
LTRQPGEIWLADVFDGGRRPVIVVSRETLNRGDVALCVPLTSSRVAERRVYRNFVFLARGAGGLREDSLAVAQLVQPVRGAALVERWGALSTGDLDRVRASLAWTVGLIA